MLCIDLLHSNCDHHHKMHIPINHLCISLSVMSLSTSSDKREIIQPTNHITSYCKYLYQSTEMIRSFVSTSMVARAAMSSQSRLLASSSAYGAAQVGEKVNNEFVVKTKDSYRVEITKGGKKVSPWHDIPLYPEELSKKSHPSGQHTLIVNYVNEIPRGSTAKMEIATKEPFNPIKQGLFKLLPIHIHFLFSFSSSSASLCGLFCILLMPVSFFHHYCCHLLHLITIHHINQMQLL